MSRARLHSRASSDRLIDDFLNYRRWLDVAENERCSQSRTSGRQKGRKWTAARQLGRGETEAGRRPDISAFISLFHHFMSPPKPARAKEARSAQQVDSSAARSTSISDLILAISSIRLAAWPRPARYRKSDLFIIAVPEWPVRDLVATSSARFIPGLRAARSTHLNQMIDAGSEYAPCTGEPVRKSSPARKWSPPIARRLEISVEGEHD